MYSEEMLDLDEMEDSMMLAQDGQQLQDVLARLRQEDESATGGRETAHSVVTNSSPHPARREPRTSSPEQDQANKRQKTGIETEMLNTMATMVQQMTETIRVQNEERNLWRQNTSAKAQVDAKDLELKESPIMVNWLNYDIKDDATTVIDMELRNALRPLNMKPELYWKSFDRIAKPCLESVENGHISAIMVNPKVVMKMHDRYAVLLYFWLKLLECISGVLSLQ
jgi:methionine aminopeptidase